MSNAIDRLKKTRRGTPVMIGEDEFFLCSLTIGELKRLDLLPTGSKTGFVIGCALCADAGGEPDMPRNQDEPDEQWAERVQAALADVPTQTIRALTEAIGSLGATKGA